MARGWRLTIRLTAGERMTAGEKRVQLLVTESNVLEALKEVYDPELGMNVVDLGLVYGVSAERGQVRVTMTLTTPGCPLHASLAEAVRSAIELMVPGAESVAIDLIWEPPWTPDRITEAGREALGWQ